MVLQYVRHSGGVFMHKVRTTYNQRTKISINYFIISFIIGMFLLFLAAGMVASLDSKYKLSSNLLYEWLSTSPTEAFVYMLGLENPYFAQTLTKESEPPSLSSISLQLMTNIKLGDIRSLIGRELPGFAIFDTKIVVAGEGTNYTNIPIESAPPMDVLMKEREIVEENLKIDETKDPITPPMNTTNGKDVIFIYQSHSTESFLPLLKGVTDKDAAHSTNSKVNMIAIGEKMTKELEQRGIGTQHDTSNMGQLLLDRGWKYGDSYTLSREIVQSTLAKNKDLNFLIDLHRDTAGKSITTATINGKPYARLFFIVGKEHDNYEKSLKTAKQLNTQLEDQFPGISRGIFVKTKDSGNGVYNQDLSESAILIEVGGVDNTLEELFRTVEAFSEVFSKYYWEEGKVDSKN
jgi:stage II sporulation protein P